MGQVAVVTGARRGLGQAYAMALAERGVAVDNRIRPGTEDQPPVAAEVAESITAAGGSAVADTLGHRHQGRDGGRDRHGAGSIQP
ncbi:hypothetical protein ABZ863_13885 [Saccharomonospora sp. NPDC046836]|uniref:hypothetical protein n=1 Tax=Saccharomonospora sp. NPDC046836 TaxID=3156921 RepID=UPI0033CB05D2